MCECGEALCVDSTACMFEGASVLLYENIMNVCVHVSVCGSVAHERRGAGKGVQECVSYVCEFMFRYASVGPLENVFVCVVQREMKTRKQLLCIHACAVCVDSTVRCVRSEATTVRLLSS